ncbi:MAG: hypothetical protein KJ901_07150 [Gammaproteobacteria bacterium]|nr:hypothetical protein [Gammaproteobacteria bacterium]MBU1441338.1 hypothetical protein [Gammaproteobacteria bacterium]
MTFLDPQFVVEAVDVQTSDLLIATPDASDPLVDSSVHQVLRLLRDQHRMEAAFVGEVLNGRRVCRDAATAGPAQVLGESGDALEIAFCRQALNVRVPFGCFLSAPVILQNGIVYGTLYSFSFSSDEGMQHHELKKLKLSAQLAGRLIDSRGTVETGKMVDAA